MSNDQELKDKQKLMLGRTARMRRIKLARRDFSTFVRFVLKDEETGDPVELAPVHTTDHLVTC